MRRLDKAIKFGADAFRKSVRDPFHYPVGTFLIPAVAALFFQWVSGLVVFTAATGPAAVNMVALLEIGIVFFVFEALAFCCGEMAYRWRMDLRKRHRRLYRLGQAWRFVIGFFAVVTVLYAYANQAQFGFSTPNVMVPIWLFSLIILGFGSLVSVGTSVVGRAMLALARWIGGDRGGGQGGATTREA